MIEAILHSVSLVRRGLTCSTTGNSFPPSVGPFFVGVQPIEDIDGPRVSRTRTRLTPELDFPQMACSLLAHTLRKGSAGRASSVSQWETARRAMLSTADNFASVSEQQRCQSLPWKTCSSPHVDVSGALLSAARRHDSGRPGAPVPHATQRLEQQNAIAAPRGL